jgi:hypothetical protein
VAGNKGILPLEENPVDFSNDGDLDTHTRREFIGGLGCGNSFSHHHHIAEDIIEIPAFPYFDADKPIPAMAAHAGHHEIPDSRQT